MKNKENVSSTPAVLRLSKNVLAKTLIRIPREEHPVPAKKSSQKTKEKSLYTQPHRAPSEPTIDEVSKAFVSNGVQKISAIYLKEPPLLSTGPNGTVQYSITAKNNEDNCFAVNRCNQIIQGDCLEVMRKIPTGTIDLIVTSPPYNLKNSTGNGMKDGRGGKWKNAQLINGYADHNDHMPHNEYVEWQRDCLSEMFRLIPDDGAIFYNHKWRVQDGRLQDRQDIVQGFPVRQIIIWRRKGGINFNPGYFLPTYEVIYLIAKQKFKLAQGANSLGDVWEFQQEMNNPHPAPFPVDLIDRIIRSTTARIVLDPFVGSGTTAIAAIMNGRKYLGIDKSAQYTQMAQERIQTYFQSTFNFFLQQRLYEQ
jgi:modification methylase